LRSRDAKASARVSTFPRTATGSGAELGGARPAKQTATRQFTEFARATIDLFLQATGTTS
jgi:hypothetical protein